MSGFGGLDSATQGRPAPNKATILPIVLLLDISNSMNAEVLVQGAPGASARLDGTRLDHLLRAVARLPEELKAIGEARRGGEIAIITFGGTGVKELDLQGAGTPHRLPSTFVALDKAALPTTLTASGHTPLAEALDTAARIVRTRNKELGGQPRYRANVWLITDGQNTEAEKGRPVEIPERSITKLRDLEDEHLALFFTVMLPGADETEIERITPLSTFPVADADFHTITKLIAVSSQSSVDPNSTAADAYRRVNDALA